MPASQSHLVPAQSAASPIPLVPATPVGHRAWPFMTLRHDVFPPGNRRTAASDTCTVILHLKQNGLLLQERGGQRDQRIARQGEFLVVPAGMDALWHAEEPQEYLSIGLSETWLRTVAGDDKLNGVRNIFGVRDALVERIGLTFLAELTSPQAEAARYLESLATVLAIHLIGNYPIPASIRHEQKGGLAPFKFRRVVEFIHANLDEDLSLACMADLVGLSPAHFCREFKRTAGLAPHKYLTQKRLEAAQRLLAETDLPIVEVSLQAGFQSQSHFTTTFRQRIGLTPKSYRDRNR